MQAKRSVSQVQAVIEQHLVDGRGIAQVFLFQFQGIVVQRLVALYRVLVRVTLAQVLAQPILIDQLTHLCLQCGRVSLEVLERGHGATTE
ncbi:hypothetical protein D3C75_1284500 [compost metagenome]